MDTTIFLFKTSIVSVKSSHPLPTTFFVEIKFSLGRKRKERYANYVHNLLSLLNLMMYISRN